MTGMFQKATKEQSKLRLALFGVSGGGKTYGALRLAKGLGGKIALIDTEHGTASKYSDRFDFDVCNLDKPTINNILMAMDQAKDYDVLIIDSLTHAWNELLQEVDKIAKAKYGGNSWSGWVDGNKKQTELINAILSFPGHVIATMRVETNWTTTVNDKGKVVPVRIGEAPKQGKQIEFEFDMLMQISQDHQAVVLKDRTGKYQDECFIIDEKLGEDLAIWLTNNTEHKDSSPSDNHSTLAFPRAPLLEEGVFLEEFKKSCKRLMDSKQIRLFMKQNKLDIEKPETIKNFMDKGSLDLEIAKFLDEVEK
jgi:hypothetical protein